MYAHDLDSQSDEGALGSRFGLPGSRTHSVSFEDSRYQELAAYCVHGLSQSVDSLKRVERERAGIDSTRGRTGKWAGLFLLSIGPYKEPLAQNVPPAM